MAIITKTETNDKVRKRIGVCRDAGLEVIQDFIGGVTEIRDGETLVLRCRRQADSMWQMDYNDEFWQEVMPD